MRVVTLGEPSGAAAQPLFVEFVNTLHWYEGAPIELIGTEAELTTWLAEHALATDALTNCLPALHRLRDHARAATEALARGSTPAETDVTAIGEALRRPTGHLALVDDAAPAPAARLAFATDASTADLLAFQVALSFVTFLEFGDRRRLKLCANPGCGFAFLDTSTNATRRWCYMRYCGNRLKARAFRRRGRDAANAT